MRGESDIIHMNLNPSNGYYRFTGLLHWIVLTVKYEFAIQHDQMVILPEQHLTQIDKYLQNNKHVINQSGIHNG